MKLSELNLRKISLENRIFAAMAAVVLCTCLFTIFTVKNLLPPALIEVSKDVGELTAKSIAARCLEDILTESYYKIRLQINKEKALNKKIKYIFVMDDSFNVLAHTFSNGFPIALKGVNKISPHQDSNIRLLDTEEGNIYDIAVTIAANSDTLGYVRIGLSEKEIQDLCDRTVGAILWAGISAVILAFYLSFLLSAKIAKPIEAMHRASEDIIMGDFSGRVRTPFVPCWEFKKCGEKECPAFEKNNLPCWCTSGTFYCAEVRGKDYAQKIDYCRTCGVYKKYSGDVVQQLAETFNLLAYRLNEKFSELSQSRQQYKELFDNAPISLWREDISEVRKRIDSLRGGGVRDFEKYWREHPDQVRECAAMVKVFDVNKATLKMYKAEDKKEFLKSLTKVFTEESYPVFAEQLCAISGAVDYFETEGINRTLTGEKIYVIIKWIFYGKSEIILAVQDITSQKKREKELRISAVIHRLLFEGSREAIMTLESPSWRFTSGNPAAVKLFGVKNEKIFTSHPPWEYSPKYQPDGQLSIDKAKKMINIALQEGTNFFEWAHKKMNGPEFYATVSLTRASIEDKIFVQAVVKDITEKKKMEDELRVSEKRYRSLFQCAGEGILIADLKAKKFRYANKAICGFLGYSEDELKQIGVADIHPEKDLKYVISEFEKQARGEKILASDIPCLRKDGVTVYADINTTALTIDGAECNVGFFSDITERKNTLEALMKNERKLIHALNVKSKFSAMVSHELRTPLTAIKEGLALMIDSAEKEMNPEQKKLLVIAKRNIDRLHRLINDVLDFSKLESGGMKFRFKKNDMRKALKEAVKTYEKAFALKGLFLHTSFSKNLGACSFDYDKILQVIINLLDNALKWTEKGGITLSAVADDEKKMVRVSVKDTGKGLNKKELEIVFRQYVQLPVGIYRKPGGTGLGLAISKEIVLAHGGTIWAESEPGKGTEFIFTLPMHEGGQGREAK